eukprot:m.83632 g.83632  ORF g.83632 m.83632 type:complete len:147 (+) comp14771_c3_seq4:317-757(+)
MAEAQQHSTKTMSSEQKIIVIQSLAQASVQLDEWNFVPAAAAAVRKAAPHGLAEQPPVGLTHRASRVAAGTVAVPIAKDGGRARDAAVNGDVPHAAAAAQPFEQAGGMAVSYKPKGARHVRATHANCVHRSPPQLLALPLPSLPAL